MTNLEQFFIHLGSLAYIPERMESAFSYTCEEDQEVPLDVILKSSLNLLSRRFEQKHFPLGLIWPMKNSAWEETWLEKKLSWVVPQWCFIDIPQSVEAISKRPFCEEDANQPDILKAKNVWAQGNHVLVGNDRVADEEEQSQLTHRMQCRIQCGAGVIIPNVLSFLVCKV